MEEKCQQCLHQKDEHYPHELVPSFLPCGAIVRSDCFEQVCSCPDFQPVESKEFLLSYNDGKAVQEVLNRYVSELEERRTDLLMDVFVDATDLSRQVTKDIDYITGLAKLFD